MSEPGKTVGARPPIKFEVEVEPGTEPIRGRLRSTGQTVDFIGWVALAGALERFMDPDAGGRAPADGAIRQGSSPP
jgi:hypothetical protein